MGSDLGGAVKGFKDGMKDGSAAAETPAAPPAQVTRATAAADKTDHRRRSASEVLSPAHP